MSTPAYAKGPLVTHIGSLPFYNEDVNVSVKKAIDFTLKWPIPALPELTNHGDAMLTYIKDPGKLSCLEAFGKHSFKLAKTECLGLVSCCADGYTVKEAIVKTGEHILAMANAIDTETLILFSDEPSLYKMDFTFELKKHYDEWLGNVRAIEELTGKTIIPGIHSCGDITERKELRRFDYLFQSDIQIINVDAALYDITTYPLYNEFRDNGGQIAWGVNFGDGKKAESFVPDQKKRIENAKAQIKDFKEGDLLTPDCGMPPKFYNPRDCWGVLEDILKLAEYYW